MSGQWQKTMAGQPWQLGPQAELELRLPVSMALRPQMSCAIRCTKEAQPYAREMCDGSPQICVEEDARARDDVRERR